MVELLKKTFLVFGIITYFFVSCNGNSSLDDYGGDELLIGSISGLLNKFHFINKNINQNYFNDTLDKYFEILDNEKIFFTKQDYEKIKALNKLTAEGDFTDILSISAIVEDVFNVRGREA